METEYQPVWCMFTCMICKEIFDDEEESEVEGICIGCYDDAETAELVGLDII